MLVHRRLLAPPAAKWLMRFIFGCDKEAAQSDEGREFRYSSWVTHPRVLIKDRPVALEPAIWYCFSPMAGGSSLHDVASLQRDLEAAQKELDRERAQTAALQTELEKTRRERDAERAATGSCFERRADRGARVRVRRSVS